MLHLPHELNTLFTNKPTVYMYAHNVKKKPVHYCTKKCLVKVLSKLMSDSTIDLRMKQHY